MPAPHTITRSQLAAAKRRVDAARRRALRFQARVDPIAFCEYVGRDKSTRAPLVLQPYHREYVRSLLWDKWSDLPRLLADPDTAGSDLIPRIDRDLVALGHPQSGKTELALLTGTWLMAHMAHRGLWPWVWWMSDTRTAATQRALEMAALIEGEGDSGKALREVFPKLAPGRRWSEQGWWISYAGQSAPGRDPSIRSAGRDTGVHGGRWHIGIFDDIQTGKNQRLPGMREKIHEGFVQKGLDRRDRLSVGWFLSNAWYEDSSDAKLVESGWREYKLTVRDESTGALNFPMMWDEARIAEESSGAAANIPGEVDRRLQCKRLPRGASSRFKEEYIKRCYAYGVRMRPGGITSADIPKGARVYTGVDLGGVNKSTAADQSCFFTIMVPRRGKRRVLNIETGRWDKAELNEVARSVYERFHVTRDEQTKRIVARHHGDFIVESVALQEYIAQDLGFTLPVRPFKTTASNKWHEEIGIDSMSGEFALGQWEIPVGDNGQLTPELTAWKAELVGFSPDTHTGDRAMASWLARMGAIEDHDYMAVSPHGETEQEVEARQERAARIAAGDEKAAAEALWASIKRDVTDMKLEAGTVEDYIDDDGYAAF